MRMHSLLDEAALLPSSWADGASAERVEGAFLASGGWAPRAKKKKTERCEARILRAGLLESVLGFR